MISKLKSYFLLTKPGIVMGNAITCAGGFALASRGEIDLKYLFLTLLGLCFIVAAGCVSNNYIDRFSDEKMPRTKNRPLVKGVITPTAALFYACALTLAGSFILVFWVNLLSFLISVFGLVVYLIFYSFSKYRTVHATLIGSFAGAVPPVVGYTAVSHHLDLGALILFVTIALWQMPHFYAIAVYRFEDYASASIPVLPIVKGMHTTKMHMLFYIAAFMLTASTLVLMHYVRYLYLIAALCLGSIWLLLCIRGFKCDDHKQWARKMFLFSLVVVMGICISIPFSV